MAPFDAAGTALNSDPPERGCDLRRAFTRDGGLIDDAANGRTTAAIRAMMLEREFAPIRRFGRIASWRIGRSCAGEDRHCIARARM
jgi:hypothetical protein